MEPLCQFLSPAILAKEKIAKSDCRLSERLFERICQMKLDIVHDRRPISENDNYNYIRPEVIQSWKRSKQYGVNYRHLNFPMLPPDVYDKLKAQKQSLIHAAEPYLQRLNNIFQYTNCYALLTDEQGSVMRIASRCPSRKSNYQVINGMVINEKTIGTCSHALCIVYKAPFQLWGPEHYCQELHYCSGSSAPIFDSLGNLAGTLTIVSDDYYHQNAHTLGLVAAMALSIQQSYQLEFNNIFLNRIFECADQGIIAVNREGTITKINDQALKLLAKLGISRDKATDCSLETLWGTQPAIDVAMNSGKTVEDIEILSPKGSLHSKSLLCSLYPIKDDFDHHYGYLLKLKEPSYIRSVKKHPTPADNYGEFTFDSIIATCAPMINEIRKAKKMADSDVNILIQGESGVGKDVFAQAIHNHSRPSGPFIAVNCAAIPQSLIASELFGYESGAFTGAERSGKRGKFELANGGTIFLDEIGDMPLEAQPVLLRVLEEKKVYPLGSSKAVKVDFRLIAATNQNLWQLVQEGKFRQDLYYRLSVFTLTIPPLRERNEDILLLAKHFIRKAAQKLRTPVPELSDTAKLHLLQYSWPGNVRQLENAMMYAVSMCKDGVIWPHDLPSEIASGVANASTTRQNTSPASDAKLNLQIKELEIISIKEALEATGNNISKTAELLGLSKSTVYRRIRKYRLLDV